MPMMILSSWDDGTIEDLKLVDLLKKYDIVAMFYFPVYPGLANGRKGRKSLDKEQRQTIAKDFDIGSHTLTHPLLTRIDPSIARTEIENSKLMLQDEFGREVDFFAYPRGYANPELQMMVKEAGYKGARSTIVGRIHPSENPYFEETTVHVGCNRKEYAGKKWLDYALDMLDQAIKTPNSVYHLFGHSWEIEKNDGWYDLEKLLKEINERPHS